MRAVLTFNPDVFEDKRRRVAERLQVVHKFFRDLSQSLDSPRCQRTRESVLAAADRLLRSKNLLDVFKVSVVDSSNHVGFELVTEFQEATWNRRRRRDGYSVLVTSSGVTLPPTIIATTYRAKNAVEYDFHVIKGLVKLRPVRHRADAKVRAHVTLCMLALALERELDRLLKAATTGYTSTRALQELESCRLCRLAYSDAPSPIYTLTRPTPDQRRLLEALGLETLLAEPATALRFRPR